MPSKSSGSARDWRRASATRLRLEDAGSCLYSIFWNTEWQAHVLTNLIIVNIFYIPEYGINYPAAIMGTAAKAATSPTNLQRVRCSLRNTRASSTVTAG